LKQVYMGLRINFYIGFFLSTFAGIQLFLFSEHTETYFAWTIQSALTAATFGAFYFGTLAYAFLGGRESIWVNVRAPTYGLFTFLCFTLFATLFHLDKFHLTSPNLLARGAAWLWIFVYFLNPLLFAVMLFLQARMPGNDPERTSPFPFWLRMILWVHGTIGIVGGLLLFFTPQLIISIWPWTLTQLTARAFSAWILAFGVLDLQTVWENDWRRARIMTIGYILFGLLPLIAMLRYASEINWSNIVTFGYLAYLLTMLVVGIYGYLQARRT
jgi:hypothetical protein